MVNDSKPSNGGNVCIQSIDALNQAEDKHAREFVSAQHREKGVTSATETGSNQNARLARIDLPNPAPLTAHFMNSQHPDHHQKTTILPNWNSHLSKTQQQQPHAGTDHNSISYIQNNNTGTVMNQHLNQSTLNHQHILGAISYQRHPTSNSSSANLTNYRSNGQPITKQIFSQMKLRKGKWTIEEEKYANLLIREFENGTVSDCENGCTLRAFLSRKLHCAPMRISKKFAGKNCIGKHVFFARNRPSTPYQQESNQRLIALEQQFYRSVLQETPSVPIPTTSVSSLNNPQLPSGHSLSHTFHQIPTESMLKSLAMPMTAVSSMCVAPSTGIVTNANQQRKGNCSEQAESLRNKPQHLENGIRSQHIQHLCHTKVCGVDTMPVVISSSRANAAFPASLAFDYHKIDAASATDHANKYDHVAAINRIISCNSNSRLNKGRTPSSVPVMPKQNPVNVGISGHNNATLALNNMSQSHPFKSSDDNEIITQNDTNDCFNFPGNSSRPDISADSYALLTQQLILAVSEHSAYCRDDTFIPGTVRDLSAIDFDPTSTVGQDQNYSKIHTFGDENVQSADDSSLVTARAANTKRSRISSLLQSSRYPGNLPEVSHSVTNAKKSKIQGKKVESFSQKCDLLPPSLNSVTSAGQSIAANNHAAVVSGSERSGSDFGSESELAESSFHDSPMSPRSDT